MTTIRFMNSSASGKADWREPREVTLEEVTDAIIKLSFIDETTLLEHASKGELAKLLPYAVVEAESPQFEAWGDVAEVSERALTDEEHERWLCGG